MRSRFARILVLLGGAGVLLGTGTPALATPANGLAGVRNKVAITTLPTSGACFDSPVGTGQCVSYSAVALAAAGATAGNAISVGGVSFVWPDAASGQPDSMSPAGQLIAVNPPAGTTTLALLGASHNGPVQTQLRLTYGSPDTNGSYTTLAGVSVPDWWAITSGATTPGANELRTPFQMLDDVAPLPVPVSVYAMKVPVDSSRQLVSVEFPGSAPSIVFFDLQLVST